MSDGLIFFFFFFFQAEDGIRDLTVTGVQTVLFRSWGKDFDGGGPQVELLRRVSHWLMKEPELEEESLFAEVRDGVVVITRQSLQREEKPVTMTRSEERRVGKECSTR